MANLTPAITSNHQVIQKYSNTGFRLNNIDYSGSVVVFPLKTEEISLLKLQDITEEQTERLVRSFIEAGTEILIIGCGQNMSLPPAHLKKSCKKKGVSFETMGTAAACRTYNVLMAEGRNICAVLIPISSS